MDTLENTMSNVFGEMLNSRNGGGTNESHEKNITKVWLKIKTKLLNEAI